MPRQTGIYEGVTAGGDPAQAFVPFPLPPASPPLDLASGDLPRLLREAHGALRLLELAGELVPSIDWFVYAFVRKEAVLSAQIEGTQATLMDLLEIEASGEPPDADVEEVCGYLDALNYAWEQVTQDDGLPLSVRLLSNTHALLLAGARGQTKQPGVIRAVQNWVGGTRPATASFVPPPPHRLPGLLSDLERWIYADSELPPLVRIGLLHVQFETLHPFLDGNGRLGRLLIPLLLRHWGLLSRPLLYLSVFLKAHRAEYYRRLDAVRTDGDWEGWLAFFLEGVAEVAREAVSQAKALHGLVEAARAQVLARDDATVLSLRLLELLPEHPMVSVSRVMGLLQCSRPAASKALGVLESAGVLRQYGEGRRNRVYWFARFLETLRTTNNLH